MYSFNWNQDVLHMKQLQEKKMSNPENKLMLEYVSITCRRMNRTDHGNT